jgi:SAM-dependent methyltransferase
MKPACAHPESAQRALFQAQDYISGDRFSLQECRACGLVRTIPRSLPDTLDHYYPDGYYGQQRRYGALVECLLRWLYSYRAWMLSRVAAPRPARVLDIGCGRGQLLQALRARGWEVAGTELSDRSAAYARDVLRIDVQTGDVLGLCLPAAGFSAVILWHVLEHVPEPALLVREVARILRPGGVLLVAVPNFASPEARWARARWFHLDVPRHLSHFVPRTLYDMLDAADLRPVSAGYLAPEYDFFSFVQTALNMLRLRQNTLFNVLRTRDAKVLRTGDARSFVSLMVSLLLAPALGAASLLWVPAVAVSRRGATISIVARKP